jgi:DNA-binding FrmR family transcriptional regulator
MSSAEARDNLMKRLQRVEGQVRGVCNMVEEERDCQDILIQLAAIRGALHQISVMVVEEYAVHCLTDPNADSPSSEAVTKLIRTLSQLPH